MISTTPTQIILVIKPSNYIRRPPAQTLVCEMINGMNDTHGGTRKDQLDMDLSTAC